MTEPANVAHPHPILSGFSKKNMRTPTRLAIIQRYFFRKLRRGLLSDCSFLPSHVPDFPLFYSFSLNPIAIFCAPLFPHSNLLFSARSLSLSSHPLLCHPPFFSNLNRFSLAGPPLRSCPSLISLHLFTLFLSFLLILSLHMRPVVMPCMYEWGQHAASTLWLLNRAVAGGLAGPRPPLSLSLSLSLFFSLTFFLSLSPSPSLTCSSSLRPHLFLSAYGQGGLTWTLWVFLSF